MFPTFLLCCFLWHQPSDNRTLTRHLNTVTTPTVMVTIQRIHAMRNNPICLPGTALIPDGVAVGVKDGVSVVLTDTEIDSMQPACKNETI